MALNIKHPDADRLARELARRRKRSITDVVLEALETALAKERQAVRSPGLAKELLDIGERYAALPTMDDRSEDEVLGYDEHGLPA